MDYTDELSFLQEQFNEGNFSEVLDHIDHLEKNAQVTYKRIKGENNEQSLSSKPYNNKIYSQMLVILAWKMRACFELGKFIDTLTLAGSLYRKAKKISLPALYLDALFNQNQVYLAISQTDVPKVLAKTEKDLELAMVDPLNHDPHVGEVIRLERAKFNLIRIYYSQFYENAEFEKSKQIAQEAFQTCKMLGSPHIIATAHIFLGSFYYAIGSLKQSITYSRRALDIVHNKDSVIKLSGSLILGNCYSYSGNLKKSLALYEDCVRIALKFHLKPIVAGFYINIGTIYTEMGNVAAAFDISLKNIGELESSGTERYLSVAYLNLLEYAYKLHKQSFIDEYLEKFRLISQNTKSEIVKDRYAYIQAYLLQKSKKSKDRVFADRTLRDLLQKESHFNLHYNAFITLWKILLEEVKMTDDPELFQEIQDLSNQIEKEAQEGKYILYLPKILRQKAKLALFNLDYDAAKHHYLEGLKMAERYNMQRSAIKISKELDRLLELEPQLKTLKTTQAFIPFAKRLELVELDSIIKKMKTQKEQQEMQIEDDPQLLVIMHESGISLYSYPFDDEWKFDDQLFSGFLSAFNSFSNEIFSHNLDRATFGSYKILIVSDHPLVYCYVIKGDSYIAQKRVLEFRDRLHENETLWVMIKKAGKLQKLIQIHHYPALSNLITEIFVQKSNREYIETL